MPTLHSLTKIKIGFALRPECQLITNVAGKAVRAREVAPCREQDVMMLREVDNGADIESEAVVTVILVSRSV